MFQKLREGYAANRLRLDNMAIECEWGSFEAKIVILIPGDKSVKCTCCSYWASYYGLFYLASTARILLFLGRGLAPFEQRRSATGTPSGRLATNGNSTKSISSTAPPLRLRGTIVCLCSVEPQRPRVELVNDPRFDLEPRSGILCLLMASGHVRCSSTIKMWKR